jgi:hypothetical protein
VVRLSVAPRSEAGPLCGVRLAWDDPATGARLSRTTSIVSRPPVPFDQWKDLPADTEVVQQAGLLDGARAQREFGQAIERGDLARAQEILEKAQALLQNLPGSAEIGDELRYLVETGAAYRSDPWLAKKMGHFRGSSRQMGLLYKMGLIPRDTPQAPGAPPQSPPGGS